MADCEFSCLRKQENAQRDSQQEQPQQDQQYDESSTGEDGDEGETNQGETEHLTGGSVGKTQKTFHWVMLTTTALFVISALMLADF